MLMPQDMQISESLKNKFLIAIKNNRIQDVKELLDKDKRLVEVELEDNQNALELAVNLEFHELILLLRPYYHNEQVPEIKDENEAKWYSTDGITNLVCCQQKKMPLLRYVFSYSGDLNPYETFKKQFRQLILLKNEFKVPVCFICMRPGDTVSSHFIFGIILEEQLIIINPLGEENQHDFYKIIFKIKDLGLINFIAISNTIVQKDSNSGIVSCGPICVELFNHCASLSQENVLAMLSKSKFKSKKLEYSREEQEYYSLTVAEGTISYNSVDISSFLPESLKILLNSPEKYSQQLQKIRDAHKVLLSRNKNIWGYEQTLIFKMKDDEVDDINSVRKEDVFLKLQMELKEIQSKQAALPKDKREHKSDMDLPIPPLQCYTENNVNPGSLYDEALIVKVWDSYIKRQKLQYFCKQGSDDKNSSIVTTLFVGSSNGMSLTKNAGILIQKNETLYRRTDSVGVQSFSISICGIVNYCRGEKHNAITDNLDIALKQILTWNKEKVKDEEKIKAHLILFPYHKTANHWNLGILELILKNTTLEKANAIAYDPQGGGRLDVEKEIQELLNLTFNSEVNLQNLSNNTHPKQQNDSASCGVITAENGKGVIDGNYMLLKTPCPSGAERLRLEHLKEVENYIFYKRQWEDVRYSESAIKGDRALEEEITIVKKLFEFIGGVEAEKKKLFQIAFCNLYTAILVSRGDVQKRIFALKEKEYKQNLTDIEKQEIAKWLPRGVYAEYQLESLIIDPYKTPLEQIKGLLVQSKNDLLKIPIGKTNLFNVLYQENHVYQAGTAGILEKIAKKLHDTSSQVDLRSQEWLKYLEDLREDHSDKISSFVNYSGFSLTCKCLEITWNDREKQFVFKSIGKEKLEYLKSRLIEELANQENGLGLYLEQEVRSYLINQLLDRKIIASNHSGKPELYSYFIFKDQMEYIVSAINHSHEDKIGKYKVGQPHNNTDLVYAQHGNVIAFASVASQLLPKGPHENKGDEWHQTIRESKSAELNVDVASENVKDSYKMYNTLMSSLPHYAVEFLKRFKYQDTIDIKAFIDYKKPDVNVLGRADSRIQKVKVLTNDRVAYIYGSTLKIINILKPDDISQHHSLILTDRHEFLDLAVMRNDQILIGLSFQVHSGENKAHVFDIQTNNFSKIKEFTFPSSTSLGVIGKIVALSENTFVRTANDLIEIWKIGDDNVLSMERILQWYPGCYIGALEKLQTGELVSGMRVPRLGHLVVIGSLPLFENTRILKGHTALIEALVNLSNGWLASGSIDCTIRIWDVQNEHSIFVLNGHTGRINSLTEFSIGLLASSSGENNIRIWNIYTGECLSELKGHSNPVSTLDTYDQCIISGSGNAIFKSDDATLRIWKFPHTLSMDDKSSKDILKNIQLIILALEYDTSVKDLKIKYALENELIHALALTLTKNKTLKTVDLSNIGISTEGVYTLLSALSNNTTINSVNLTGNLIPPRMKRRGIRPEIMRVHDLKANFMMSIEDLSLSTMQAKIDDLSISTFDFSNCMVRDYTDFGSFNGPKESIFDLRLKLFPHYPLAILQNNLVAIPIGRSHIIILDVYFGRCIANLKIESAITTLLAEKFSVAGSELKYCLLGGMLNGTIQIWNVQQQRSEKIFCGHTGYISALVKLDDYRLISSSADGFVKVWDINRHPEPVCLETLIPHGGYSVSSLVMWPNSSFLAIGSDSIYAENTIKVWKIQNYESSKEHITSSTLEYIIPAAFRVSKLEALQDFQLASCFYQSSDIELWDIKKSIKIGTLIGHMGSVWSMKKLWNNQLASGGTDKRIIIWDLGQKRFLKSLPTSLDYVLGIEEFPDGTITSINAVWSSWRILFGSTNVAIQKWRPYSRLLKFADIEPLIHKLQSNMSVTSLVLDNVELNAIHILTLQDILKKNKNVVKISLCDTGLNKKEISNFRTWAKTEIPEKKLYFDTSDVENLQKQEVAREASLLEEKTLRDYIEDESNKVTIHLWLHPLLQTMQGKAVGHASLQTYGKNSIYASFWPENNKSTESVKELVKESIIGDRCRCHLRLLLNKMEGSENAIKEGNEIIIVNNNDEFVIFYKKEIDKEIGKFSCDKDLKVLLSPLTFNGKILVKDQKSEELYELVYREVRLKGGEFKESVKRGYEFKKSLDEDQREELGYNIFLMPVSEPPDLKTLNEKYKKEIPMLIKYNDQIWIYGLNTNGEPQLKNLDISLSKINKYYCSLFDNKDLDACFEVSKKCLPFSIYEDIALKNGHIRKDAPAYHKVDLYSLDAVNISNSFLAFKGLNYDWSMLASSKLGEEKTFNCCSLVFYLLQKGGIEKLLKEVKKHREVSGKYAGTVGNVLTAVGFSALLLYRFFVPDGISQDSLQSIIDLHVSEGDVAAFEWTGWLWGAGKDTRENLVLLPKDLLNMVTFARNVEQNQLGAEHQLIQKDVEVINDPVSNVLTTSQKAQDVSDKNAQEMGDMREREQIFNQMPDFESSSEITAKLTQLSSTLSENRSDTPVETLTPAKACTPLFNAKLLPSESQLILRGTTTQAQASKLNLYQNMHAFL